MILLGLATSLFACSAENADSRVPQPAGQAKKAVFIILDGIPADVLEKTNTPTLDQIAAKNGYTRAYVGGELGAYSETPTISAPGYMCLLTATWANKHNVVDNYDQQPNYNYWNIFRIVESANPALHTAIFSTWQDNRTVLLGEGREDAGKLTLDYHFDGMELDTVRFPHDPQSQYILAIDELVAAEAGRYIAEKGPDLSWVYLQYTDDISHEVGDAEAFYEAVEKADAQVKQVWDAVKKRQALGEDWMIVVTTDHGRDAQTGKDHGGQSPRERETWIVANLNEPNPHFTQQPPAITDISPSILRHLGISIPEPQQMEMDGIPFIGNISLDGFKAAIRGDEVSLSWRPLEQTGYVNFLLSTSNHFARGGEDEYLNIGKAPLSAAGYAAKLNAAQLRQFGQSGIIKVVAQAPNNWANYRIVGEK